MHLLFVCEGWNPRSKFGAERETRGIIFILVTRLCRVIMRALVLSRQRLNTNKVWY